MKALAFKVKKIDQIDNHTFMIEWGDGLTKNYRLSDLQKNCPCANCVDENTGKRLNTSFVKDDVKALNIMNVGRYALRIQFDSGCCRGIFGFDKLREHPQA